VWPLWEGFDEWAHFSVAQEISKGQLVIDRNAIASREISISLQLTPIPRGMTFTLPQSVTREQYWLLPVEERARREAALQTLTAETPDKDLQGRVPAYEASQPPLYYWLIAIVLRVLRNAALVNQVWFARVVTFAIGSLAFPIGFILCRRVFRGGPLAFGLCALVALMPGLAINLARISNESLGIVVCTGLLLAVCRWIEKPQRYARSLGLGICLGLGLLTKAYFLTAIPAVLLIFLSLIWRDRDSALKVKENAMHAAFVFAVALGIGGWWYLRNYLQTGTVSGLDEALMLRNISLAGKLSAILRLDWHAAFDTVLLSHIWYAGWSLFGLRGSIYRVFKYVLFVAACGLAVSRLFLKSSVLFCILVLYGFFWLGQCYQIVMLFISKSSSTAMGGWYLYSMVWAEVILFIAGIFAVVPMRFRKILLGTFIVAMAALDVYSLHVVAIPYYAHTRRLLSPDVFRLLLDKPQFLNSSALVFLWALFFLSTGLTVFAGCIALRGFHTAREFGDPGDE
jgi:4-amino-4-deoxy-L-arabinose transferase-like glycosyltransferase